MSFQAVFLLAAWLALVEICQTIERDGASSVITFGNCPQAETKVVDKDTRIDYEQTRSGRGMKIQAQKLTFKYPGATASTPTNINLTIKPGESLAIVGYDGSGESYRTEPGPGFPLIPPARRKVGRALGISHALLICKPGWQVAKQIVGLDEANAKGRRVLML